MPPLISPQKKKRLRDERRDDVLMTCYYLDLGSASNWLKQFFFFYQLSQTHMLLVIINYCFVSRIPCSFLFLLVPLVPPLSPCSPLFFCSPCSPLFPFVPLFPLFPLSPPLSSCSAFFPLFPLVLVCSLIPSCAPCSPVSLVRLQFTTLNV